MVIEKEEIIREEDLTDEQRRERREWGRELVEGIDWALKMARGEVARPEKPLREWLTELQEEIDRGDFDDDESD